jgi:hypothetical protein
MTVTALTWHNQSTAEANVYVHGNGLVRVPGGKEVVVKFKEEAIQRGTWLDTVTTGDRIHVLLHPTKDEVLVAYGP